MAVCGGVKLVAIMLDVAKFQMLIKVEFIKITKYNGLPLKGTKALGDIALFPF